jgi:hypothetical protein
MRIEVARTEAIMIGVKIIDGMMIDVRTEDLIEMTIDVMMTEEMTIDVMMIELTSDVTIDVMMTEEMTIDVMMIDLTSDVTIDVMMTEGTIETIDVMGIDQEVRAEVAVVEVRAVAEAVKVEAEAARAVVEVRVEAGVRVEAEAAIEVAIEPMMADTGEMTRERNKFKALKTADLRSAFYFIVYIRAIYNENFRPQNKNYTLLFIPVFFLQLPLLLQILLSQFIDDLTILGIIFNIDILKVHIEILVHPDLNILFPISETQPKNNKNTRSFIFLRSPLSMRSNFFSLVETLMT